jgi:hypothetical protein
MTIVVKSSLNPYLVKRSYKCLGLETHCMVRMDVADLSPCRYLCNLSLCRGLCKKELYRRGQPGSFASPLRHQG